MCSWDIMGQQIVGDLAHCLTTALNAAIPALVDTLNPMKKLKAAGDVVGSFAHPKDNKPDGGDSDAPPPVKPRPTAAPKAAADPAYAEVLKVTTYLSGLKAIVQNKENDIDWDLASGEDGAKSSVAFIKEMLGDQQKSFGSLKTNEEPSNTLSNILEVTTKVSQNACRSFGLLS